MTAGVSTACLYPRTTEDSLYDLTVNGVQTVEIFINAPSELKRGFACSVRDTLRRFEARCISVHPFTSEIETMMLYSAYERRTNDFLEFQKRYFEFMNIVGAEIFVLHGGKGGPNYDMELFCERYSLLYRLGKQYGVTVALENVSRCKSCSASVIREMAGMLGDECAFVIDTKQAVRSGENPFSFLEAAGKRTAHVHISDYGEMGDCLPIGKGHFKIRKFLERLYEYNPECGVILELYRSGFRGISDLTAGYGVLNKMIESIQDSRATI